MAASFTRKLARLGSDSLVYGLSSIVGRLLSFLLQPYYAHQFDPAQNGIQSVVYSYVPIISIALYLGMDVAYMRNAAGISDAPETERRRAFTGPFAAVVILGGIGFAAASLLAGQLGPLLKLDAESFRYLMAIVYSDALLAVPYAHLRMANRAKRYAALRLVFVALSVGLNIWLIGYLHWGVRAIFLANVVANLTILALMLGEILSHFRPRLLRGVAWKPLWRYALPIMPAMLAVMLVENGDRIVLNYLSEDTARRIYAMAAKDVVGIYSFNYKLGVVMLLVVQMFRLAWTPFALQHSDDPAAPQLFSRVLTALTLACALVFLAVAIFLPVLVHVPAVFHYVKRPYWIGLPIVPVILLGYAFSGVYAVVTTGLYIERRTGVLPWISGAGAVLNLGICLVAAREWGFIGVAWATPAAYALMAMLGAWQAQKVFPVPFEWGRVALVWIIVACIFVADRLLTPHLTPELGAVAKAFLLALFPIALVAIRFFRKGEVAAMRSLLSGLRPSPSPAS